FTATATLQSDAGNPIAGRLIEFHSTVGYEGYDEVAFGTTDEFGRAQAELAASTSSQPGVYVSGVRVRFDGDIHYRASQGASDVTATYDGQAHSVPVVVTGVHSVPLSPVAVTYNGAGTAPSNAGVYAVSARYDESANYNAVSGTATLTILKVAPSITWPVPAPITYGTALNVAQLNASADVSGTFRYSPAAGTVLPYGPHILSVTFTPTDAVDYATA